MKTGLVLEGGGMRGIYTAGVLDVLMENDINVDGVVGVSAGAIHGASFVSKQQGRNIRYITKYCGDWRFMSLRSLIVTGDVVGYKFSYEELPFKLDPFDFDTFFNNPTKFYATATNLRTGAPEYLDGQDRKNCLDILRASSSMPLVSHIVKINGQEYLDGGTSDSVPLRAFMNMGYDRNIVILTQPKGFRKKQSSILPLVKIKYRKYPAYVRANAERYKMYNKEMEDLEALAEQGKILLIQPSRKINISRVENNPELVREQYELGRSDATNMLNQIKLFLAAKESNEEK